MAGSIIIMPAEMSAGNDIIMEMGSDEGRISLLWLMPLTESFTFFACFCERFCENTFHGFREEPIKLSGSVCVTVTNK